MQPSVSREPATTGLLTIRAASNAWGIPSSAVQGVEACGDTPSAKAPLDVLALLGAAPAAPGQASRVVVLNVHGEELRLLVHGVLTLTETSSASLLPLPPALQQTTPLVSHVAVVDGRPALFVLSPERLLEVAHVEDTNA